MELSPKRQPSPPFLKGGRKSKSGSDLDLNADDGATQSARRRSFGEGSSMTLQTNAAEIASDARASEEAKLWREQLRRRGFTFDSVFSILFASAFSLASRIEG